MGVQPPPPYPELCNDSDLVDKLMWSANLFYDRDEVEIGKKVSDCALQMQKHLLMRSNGQEGLNLRTEFIGVFLDLLLTASRLQK